MGLFSVAKLFGMTIRESATDGSDFTNPDADYRRLFLGEDGLMHLKDSAGTVTDVGGASGSVATDAIWDAAGDLAVGTGANTAHKLAAGTAGQVLVSAGAADPAWKNHPFLGLTVYAPASQTIYSCTSTTISDVDATNLSVTFTAPANGKVLVRVSCWIDESTGSTDMVFGLRESTTNLSGSITRVSRDNAAHNNQQYVSVPMYQSGVSAGSHTYKLSFGLLLGSATHRIIIQDGTGTGTPPSGWGPAIMEVWACP